MKKTKVILFSILSIFLLSLSSNAIAIEDWRKKRKKKSSKKEIKIVVKTPAQKEKEKYNKLIKGADTKKGMFTTHFTSDGKLYLEMSDIIENRVFLMSNRIASTTDTQDFVAGQMVENPFMIRFKVDTNRVVMYRVREGYEVAENDPIKISFDRNLGDGILKTFKPIAKNEDNMVIDVTSFFGTNETVISPLAKANPMAAMFGGKGPIKGTFSKSDSYISGVKTFPKNIEIKSLLNFNRGANMSYTLGVHRSLVLLPEVPLKKRIQDNRVGYFSLHFNEFSSSNDGIKSNEYINRWRMEPREEDMDKYFAGELVVPKKPIVFYIDNAFPEKWRSTVIQGVEDWKLAFEAAGFKDAISARMYPTKEEDPDFDPDDMRYSCVKYATTNIANAMGPSYFDPRSGEILVGDVIWYHNVVSLVHNWRFVQTAAVDPRVRKLVFDNDLMCESLRYVASHEIGHTLGLMHNMGASYSYPVDSLRSPSFTQMYGTTPSIMDYARNNYVAQPGDLEKGVRLTPPIIGVYDIHAINWGYRIFKDSSPENVKKELSKIITDKSGDDMYRFGAQQVFGTIDPTDLTEDLGDDHIKASDYCISNLKIILDNLQEWHKDSGESYEELVTVYKEVVKQYLRVIFHVSSDIGGIELKEVMQGEPSSNKTAVYKTKAEQKRAMLWIINQARTNLEWITPKYVVNRFSQDNILPNTNDNMSASFISSLFSHTAIGRMYVSSVRLGDKKAYTVEGYYNDLVNAIFSKSTRGLNLTPSDMEIEAVALDKLMKLSGVAQIQSKSKKSIGDIADKTLAMYKDELGKSAFLCSHAMRSNYMKESCGCSSAHSPNDKSLNSFFRVNMSQTIAPKVLTQPIAYTKIKWIKNLYKKKRANANNATRNFYDYQLVQIEKFLLIK